jgi:hypothetical protein
MDQKDIINKSLNRALGGGLSGAGAMVIQVSSLMWLRTTMNYQYRYGTTTINTIQTLYKQGGVLRFYRGFGPAILQGPLSRFGDTAANVGMNTYLNSNENTKNLPTTIKTLAASGTASLWRIFLMPIDTTKTILQVEGKKGITVLRNKIRIGGPSVLYHGALGACSATFVGHYPWFLTYNVLNERLPNYDSTSKNLVRNGTIGFTASIISDCISNSLRVVKTTRQTFNKPITYKETIKYVIQNDGIKGLLGRGLKTRIIANGTQGLLFSILWKYFQEKIDNNSS